MDHLLQASPLWRDRAHLWRRVPGVGPTLAFTLVADLPDRGQGAANHVAAVVGLAPRTRDRGAWRGSRAIGGGRRPVRAALYLAALVGVRHHPVLRTCYDGLLARGQPKQVAVTAWMQKLLTILPAVLRDRTPWQPKRLAT